MEKFLKIGKVNLLSLLALPLLLIATVSKLIAKALEKVAVILGMVLLLVLLALAFEFFKNPEGGLQVALYLIVFLVICFLIVMIVIFLMNVAAAVIITIWNAVIGFFHGVYELSYVGFLKLYSVCENDYQYINLNGKRVLNGVLCLFYSVLHGMNRLIVLVVSLALPLSVILSIVLVLGTILDMNVGVRKAFGINLFQFIGKFDAFSLVYGVVMYLAIMAICVVILLSLGFEWYEWAQELKMTGEEFSEHIRSVREREIRVAQEEQKDAETGDAYMQNLEEHIDGAEALGEWVSTVLAQRDNPLLRSAWGIYFRNLSKLVEECAKYKKGIPLDKFRKLIPQIQQLEKQREDVKKLAEKLEEANRDPFQCAVFFSGCNSPEKLEKRYKSLCKAYHPDSEGGDKDTFQKMQEEYEALKNNFDGQV
ncbi:MAG: J domain-containing protein [Roseburia sp.]|nr:J domain-containing protein [Roseburia sp.]